MTVLRDGRPADITISLQVSPRMTPKHRCACAICQDPADEALALLVCRPSACARLRRLPSRRRSRAGVDAALQPGHEVTADGRHTLNLKDADIQALIATVSEITGKNFIVGPNVQGKVTVISARADAAGRDLRRVPVGAARARLCRGAVRQHGEDRARGARADRRRPAGGGRAHAADELVTQIVPVKHVSAAELVPILRPLMPQGGQIIAHASSNSLIISDRAGNVQRLAGIIQRIDTASDAEVEVIPLTHANAAEIARTLTSLADDKSAPANGEAPRVFADTRTNSILLSGAKNGRLQACAR